MHTPVATGVVMLISVALVPMGLSGTALALPDIAHELGAAPGPLQWVVNGFNVVFAAGTLLWAVGSRRLGHRTVLLLRVALYLAASVLCAVAADVPFVAVGRALAAVGGGAIFTSVAALFATM